MRQQLHGQPVGAQACRIFQAGKRRREIHVHRHAGRAAITRRIVVGMLPAEEAHARRVARMIEPRPRRKIVAVGEHPDPCGDVKRLLDVAQHRPDVAPVLLGIRLHRKRLRADDVAERAAER